MNGPSSMTSTGIHWALLFYPTQVSQLGIFSNQPMLSHEECYVCDNAESIGPIAHSVSLPTDTITLSLIFASFTYVWMAARSFDELWLRVSIVNIYLVNMRLRVIAKLCLKVTLERVVQMLQQQHEFLANQHTYGCKPVKSSLTESLILWSKNRAHPGSIHGVMSL